MKEKLFKLHSNKFYAFFWAVVGALPIVLFYAARSSHWWVHNEVPIVILFGVLFSLLALVMLAYSLALVFVKEMPKKFVFSHILASGLTIIFLIVAIVFYSQVPLTYYYIGGGLAFAAAMLFVVYSLFFHEKIESKKLRLIVAVCLSVCIILPTSLIVADARATRFVSGAVVFDIGEDAFTGQNMYSVVFATNKSAVGFIDIEQADGEFLRFNSTISGNARIGRVHTVRVPREQLQNKDYTIGVYTVQFRGANGHQAGREILGGTYAFRGTPQNDEEIVIFGISDWHTIRVGSNWQLERMVEIFEEQHGKPDLVWMLGDAGSTTVSEQEFIDLIVGASYAVSGGVVPVIYARGNHETRGRGLHNLAYMFGMDRLYFHTDYAHISFTVFDNGEDKADDHVEYGGLAFFEDYRLEQMAWLKRLQPPTKDLHFALSHMTRFGLGGQTDLNNQWFEELERLNVNFMAAGHSHNYGFQNIPTAAFRAIHLGGTQNDDRDFNGTLLILRERELEISVFDLNGERVWNYDVPL
jgi:hypothetical protein